MEILPKRRSHIAGLLQPGLAKAGIPDDQQKAFIGACLLHMKQMTEGTYHPDSAFDVLRRIKHLSHAHGITTEQATGALMEDPARLFKDGAPIARQEEPAQHAAQTEVQSATQTAVPPVSAPSAIDPATADIDLLIAALVLGSSFKESAKTAERNVEPSTAAASAFLSCALQAGIAAHDTPSDESPIDLARRRVFYAATP